MLKKSIFRFKTKYIVLLSINILLITLFIVVQCISSYITNGLPSQKLADRWSVENRFGQISVYLSENSALSIDDIYAIRSSVDTSLETDSITPSGDNARLWIDAYSAEGSVTVNREDKSVESVVTAVGGDFFLFQPLELLSGSYFGDSAADDLVIIDENLAWLLFGSSSVAGLELEIGGRPYIVAGVSKCEDDFASKAAYGEEPRIYMSFSAYERVHISSSPSAAEPEEGGSPDSGDGNTLGITVYEALIPNPVKNYALNTLGVIFEGDTDKSFSIVENSNRYSISNLFGLITSFGIRSMNQKGIYYPYWENAARITEDYGAALFLLSILLIIMPVISLVFLLIKLWRLKKWRVADIKKLAERIIENIRLKKKIISIPSHPDKAAKDLGRIDISDEISEIVQSVIDDNEC